MEGMPKWFVGKLPEEVPEAANDNAEGLAGKESVEKNAEVALELHNSIEAEYGNGEYFGKEASAGLARMNELSELLHDPEVRKVFEEKLLAVRQADTVWIAPSERQAA